MNYFMIIGNKRNYYRVPSEVHRTLGMYLKCGVGHPSHRHGEKQKRRVQTARHAITEGDTGATTGVWGGGTPSTQSSGGLACRKTVDTQRRAQTPIATILYP